MAIFNSYVKLPEGTVNQEHAGSHFRQTIDTDLDHRYPHNIKKCAINLYQSINWDDLISRKMSTPGESQNEPGFIHPSEHYFTMSDPRPNGDLTTSSARLCIQEYKFIDIPEIPSNFNR